MESIIDMPIMIPHPVIGIALLSIAGRNHWIGQMLLDAGIRIMGTNTGIVAVLVFVGLPFYLNAARDGFEAVPERLEKAARTLGASPTQTFFRVTLPLAWRSLLTGMIMCMARALSEFGAVVIVAYHPMIAPVLMYERFHRLRAFLFPSGGYLADFSFIGALCGTATFFHADWGAGNHD